MSKDAVLRLKSSQLFNALSSREIEDGFSNKLSSKIETIVENVSDLLERIPENMPEYTLHDPNHSAKIVDIIGKFLPPETLQHLNSIELSLIILSAYLHDIGMTASKEEKEDIIANNEDYKILFKTLIDKKEKYEYYKSIGEHRAATFIEDQVFTEFLRRNHVKRSADYIKNNLNEGQFFLEINGIPFWKHLITICNGHGESVRRIRNTQAYPSNTLVGDKIINVQFLALILRLGDILDLDPERTPKIIYEFINPQDPISIIEWKKHRSIIGYSITSEKILFEAECSVPEVERALKEFMNWIEFERKQTMQLLHDYALPSLKNYSLFLDEEVSIDRIRSDGSYIYNDLKFEINYQKVIDILMGQRLYRSPVFALRELLQNSCDAIKARQEMYLGKVESFEPSVCIEIENGKLCIRDNGIGMDFEIFKNYFLQIGKSYYSSPAFYSSHSEIDVTSEFGIGVLSVFMIANSLYVESRREPYNPIEPPKPINFEIPTAYSYTIQKQSQKTDIGTVISLKLKLNKPFKEYTLDNILSQIVPQPLFPITLNINGQVSIYKGIEKVEISKVPDFSKIKDFHNYVFDDFERENRGKSFNYSFFEIDFANSNNPILSDIQGKLYLVNSGKYNWYSLINGFFCQRNFVIGTVTEESTFQIQSTDNIKKLFPDWLTYYSTLNLTKSACLSVTPDRTDIVIDDKFERLKEHIEDFIISKLTEHFESFLPDDLASYIDFLIYAGFINVKLYHRDKFLSENAVRFLSNYITFPVLCSDGKTRREKAIDISQSNTICTVSHILKEDDMLQLSSLISSPDLKIINLYGMKFNISSHKLEGFINRLLLNTISISISTSILTKMLPAFEIKMIKPYGQFDLEHDRAISYKILETLDSDPKKILCVPEEGDSLYITFNSVHPLINHLYDEDNSFKKNGDLIIRKLQGILLKNIEAGLKRIGEVDKLYFNMLFENSEKNYYHITNGLLAADKLFLESLNNDMQVLWALMLELGIVTDKVAPVTLNAESFPSYWSNVIQQIII